MTDIGGGGRHRGLLDLAFGRFYDLIAPIYDLLWSRPSMRRSLVEMLTLQPGERVLETGVGTGINLPYISQRLGPTGLICGIDISPRMLEKARRRAESLATPVELREGNASRLPYPDSSFDAVLQFGGINFFSDRASAVREMLRVTRPGGRILVADETLAPLGRLRRIISGSITFMLPRLRPPLHLFPPDSGRISLTYSPGGLFYIILLEKGPAWPAS